MLCSFNCQPLLNWLLTGEIEMVATNGLHARVFTTGLQKIYRSYCDGIGPDDARVLETFLRDLMT